MSSCGPRLKDVCTVTSSKRIFAADYVIEGIPFVRGKEVVDHFKRPGRIQSELFISRNKFEAIRDRFGAPAKGDILLTSVGTLGVPYLVQEGDEFYFKDGNLLWFREVQGFDSRYLFYWLKSHDGRSQLQKCTIGTSQSAYTIERLKEIQLPGTSLHKQQRIASVLSGYDDLIENNRRRIQLLEESARLLYKEWFVNLRFPGHEHTKVLNGVPEGWERVHLKDIATITMGQSPPSAAYNTVGNGLPFHQGVSNFAERFPITKVHCSVKGRMAETGDILFSVRAPVGRINIATGKYVIGRGLSAIRGLRNNQNWLYYALRNHFFKEDMLGGGAIFNAITKQQLYDVKLLNPSQVLIAMFTEHIEIIDFQIRTLSAICSHLEQSRDLILSPLMSGHFVAAEV